MKPLRGLLAGLALVSGLAAKTQAATITIGSLSGPVTTSEINSFKSYVQTSVSPAANNFGNAYVYGNTGRGIEGMGLMYEVSADRAILDRMIQFSDAMLQSRSFMTSWTGQQEYIWPNSTTNQGGTEQGDILGHMAYTAKLILQTPSLWNTPVSVGDPNSYGATYRERALTFIAEADRTASGYLKRFVNPAKSNRYYFTGSTYWGNSANDPVPWNQQMMINNGFQRLAECYELLGTNPTRVTEYDGHVQTSIDWFLDTVVPYNVNGKTAYTWGYASGRTNEDVGHGAYDIGGVMRAYFSGRYDLSRADMLPFAVTMSDVITKGPKLFSQRVNGGPSDGTQNWMLGEYVFLGAFDPTNYTNIAIADIAAGGRQKESPHVSATILWVKNGIHQGLFVPEPSGLWLAVVGGSLCTGVFCFRRRRS